jgi:hypothetical protein
MSRNWNDLVAATDTSERVLHLAIAESAGRTATAFLEELRALRGSTRVFRQPSMLFTTSRSVLGDLAEIGELVPEEEVRELVAFPPWIGLTAGQIAVSLLREETSVHRALSMVAAAMGGIEELGSDKDRQLVLFEKLNEFFALSTDLLHRAE